MSDNQEKEAKGGSNKLVLVLVALNLVTMAGFGAFVFLGGAGKADAQAAAPAADAAGAAAEAPAAGHEAPAAGHEAPAGHGEPAPAEGAEASPAAPAAESSQVLGEMVTLGSFVINLNDTGANRYLKAVIKAEVSGRIVATEISSREPQLRDAVIGYLSSLTLRETQGVRAKVLIRENLVRRLNNLLTEGEVRQVFFTEFVTQ